MATINFSGIGSNIDFSQITNALVAERMQPVIQLQTKSSGLSSRSSALKQLNGLLATLTSASTALTSKSLGVDRASSSSDNSVVTASTTSCGGPGQHSPQYWSFGHHLNSGLGQLSFYFCCPGRGRSTHSNGNFRTQKRRRGHRHGDHH